MTISLEHKGDTNARHILGLDLLRFFAAVLVMLFHLAYLDWTLPGSTAFRLSGGAISFPEFTSIAGFGWIGVQIFFVISGFVIAYSAENVGVMSFVRSRTLRLFPTAWICATLSFIALSLSATGPVSFSTYERSLLLWPWGSWVDPSYWTLGIEMFFYAAVALLIATGRIALIRNFAFILGIVSTIYWKAWWLSQIHIDGSLHLWLMRYRENRLLELLLVQHGCFFALGVLLWSQLLKQGSRVAWLVAAIFTTTCLLQIVAQHDLAVEKIGLAASVWPPLVTWLCAILWVVLSVRYNAQLFSGKHLHRTLRRIGLLTYPLYLNHQVLGCLLLGILASFGMDRYLALALSISLVLVLSNFICNVLEPPLRTMLRQGFTIVHRYA